MLGRTCGSPPTYDLSEALPSALLMLLPQLLGCGLSQPAPDLITPSKAAAAIWTWAPGHPYEPTPMPPRSGNTSSSSSSGVSGGGSGRAGGSALRQQQQARLGPEVLGMGDGEVSWGLEGLRTEDARQGRRAQHR